MARTEREPRVQSEGPTITPEALLVANKSDLSQERMRNYQSAKKKGNLILLKLCADSRAGPALFDDDCVAADRSIAAGMDPGEYQFFIRHEGVRRIIIAPHFDGEQSIRDGAFGGCGGQDAYKALHNGQMKTSDHPVGPYIQASVFSDNPFVQAFRQKDAVMKQFEGDFKEIMIGAIDHRSGQFIPVWFVEKDKEDEGIYHTHSTLQSHLIQRPQLITPANIREYPIEKLPSAFRKIVIQNREYTEALRKASPLFSESQRIQNPEVVFVTTSLIPLRNRFAGLCDVPNKNFVIGAPFIKGDNGETIVASEATILSQVSYPVEKSLHAQTSDDSFGRTQTIVFETNNIAESVDLAGLFSSQDFGREWLAQRNGKIIVAETKSGLTTHIGYLED